MKKSVNARARAIKETFKEKARIFRKKTQTTSALEKAALEWKERKGAEARKNQKEALQKEELALKPSIAETSNENTQIPKQKEQSNALEEQLSNDIEWTQYKLGNKDEQEKAEISLNTATVRALAKKIISSEWNRILGKSVGPSEIDNLEREATLWIEKKKEAKRKRIEARMERIQQKRLKKAALMEKRLAQRRKKEEEKLILTKKKDVLGEALKIFSRKLKPEKDPIDHKMAAEALKEALENVGEILDISWQEKACWVWLEPWEEMKLRKARGESIPIIYRAGIGDDLEVISFKNIKDKDERIKLRRKILFRVIESLLKGVSHNIDNEVKNKELLENTMSEVGRVVNVEKKEMGWMFSIEPWEEVRIRNIKRGGKSPILTEEINIGWKDGKLELTDNKKEVLK